ncbi:MAG: YceI family protein [Chromatiaceae bacterium]|nr:YceI family protein [Gammaproteobacteria bacterium]MCP5300863.1 YceI family protein [Chromatiaceae bacterium]MCP5421664.1 YceI family protein [Chromatiaceae bacterium]
MTPIVRLCLLSALTVLPGACSLPRPQVVQPVPAAVAVPGGVDVPAPDWIDRPGRDWVLDRAGSYVRIRVYRGGRLARLGHNHVLQTGDLDGRVRMLDEGAGVAALRFRADALIVDDPAVRAAAGDDFASVPDAAAVAGTRSNLLGADVLDAVRWPQVTLVARVDALQQGHGEAMLHLSLRGSGRRYRLPVTVVRQGGRVTVSGVWQVSQQQLGITPFAVLGGALQVRDRLDVDFRVAADERGAPL